MRKTSLVLVDDLARKLTHLLGRGVFVHRERHHDKLRYYLDVEGSHPYRFGPMSITEAKGRLAMLIDMLSAQVIQKKE